MKLETKHIIPYLPFCLKWQFINRFDSSIKSGIIADIAFEEDRITLIRLDFRHSFYEHFFMFRPILKPMSSLTEAELRAQGFWTHIDYLTNELGDRGFDWIQKAPYTHVQYLFSQHYDVFGLIEAGLAVNSEIK